MQSTARPRSSPETDPAARSLGAAEIRGSEVLSVWWNRHILRDAKEACRDLYGGLPFGRPFFR